MCCPQIWQYFLPAVTKCLQNIQSMKVVPYFKTNRTCMIYRRNHNFMTTWTYQCACSTFDVVIKQILGTCIYLRLCFQVLWEVFLAHPFSMFYVYKDSMYILHDARQTMHATKIKLNSSIYVLLCFGTNSNISIDSKIIASILKVFKLYAN